ncbi:Protein of unknown function (DUF3638) domain containing protein [Tylopilus felleus]
MTHRVAGEDLVKTLQAYYSQCRVAYLDSLNILKNGLGPTTDPRDQVFGWFGCWPAITADGLLCYLASTFPSSIPPHWNKCLTSLALLLLDLQRSWRLLWYALDGLEEELAKELENEGCDGWNPEDYPDWLLIQIQGNFLVNMGEGKSSVIIPIAAAALADALAVQMFDLLVARLGGLTNRTIYHLPFSQTPEYDSNGKCMAERGILLAQPEHVVSLKLMGIEEQLRNRNLVADTLPKLEKIYKYIRTSLSLNSKENILGSMSQWLSQWANFPASKADAIQVDHDDEDNKNDHAVSDSASKWLSLQKWLHSHVQDILDESDEVLHSRFQLVYTLGSQKHIDGYPDRWTVIQQLEQREDHSTAATILAVPYRAKDVPALNTQFGHPDLTIILTCLSYYYSGLRNEQLRTSFEILFDQDELSEEYVHWMKEYRSVPDSLHKLSEINLASLEQWDKVIFPFFAWNQATIDFYLSQVVFLKEAKEFPWKFSGSSWDLAEKREKLITGFSGTNNGRWLLPMSIAQRDIDHQKGSNARVLAYLLRPENGSYMVTHKSNARWITHVFLQLVTTQQPEICVLLDVGSQILDLSGRQVAEAWLEIARDAPGAIYFSNTDELMILT